VFHPERWDYVYLLKRGKGGEVQQRQLTVLFKENRLAEFKSDPMPPEKMADNLILGRDAFKIKKNESRRPSDPGRETPGPIYQ
jgi:outer membrane protein assembly factor BamE (lipoprotein component of BamABCDE complex)